MIMAFCLGFSFAQNINFAADTITVDCTTGAVLFDSGGAGADYGNNQNIEMTICPSNATQGLVLSWNTNSIAQGDQLCAFDGLGVTNQLLGCFDQSNGTTQDIRSTITNPNNGCITLLFTSDPATTGDFELAVSCLPPCQSVDYYIDFIDPSLDTNNYSFVTLEDTFTICATGIYGQNNTSYAQSDATSNFYWDLGNGVLDTGQCISYVYPNVGIFQVGLLLEDVNGCQSGNLQFGIPADSLGTGSNNPIKVVVLPDPEVLFTFDSIICVGDDALVSATIIGPNLPNNYIGGDTIYSSNTVATIDTQYAGDNAGAVNCDGIYVPLVYDLPILGYQPGATITNINQIIEVCAEIEHSFFGDLDIIIQCPNGQQTFLVDNNCAGLGFALGEPHPSFVDSIIYVGTPYEYCWSPAVTAPIMAVAPLVANTLPAGTYASQNPWASLIGCPMNGTWQFIFADDWNIDDGFVFSASIELDQSLLLAADTIPLAYENIGAWQADSNTVSVAGNDMIVNFSTPGLFDYTFVVTDIYGNTYDMITQVDVVGFDVDATPEVSTICQGEGVQLNAEVSGTVPACLGDYFSYSIPYDKEVNPAGAGTPIVFSQADNGFSQSIPIPFPFEFYCAAQTQVRVTTNGYLTFTNSGISIASNTLIPTGGFPSNFVALMWDDLIDSAAVSNYFTVGAAPNRRFVIMLELIHVGGTSATEAVVGQIVLHEGTNMIDVICENCQQDASDPTASQGIENNVGLGGVASTGRNNSAWNAVQDAVRFYPQSTLNTDFTLNWTPTTGLAGFNTQAPVATPLTSTDYEVSITDQYGCSYSDTVTVNVGGNFSFTVSPDTTICLGDSVQLFVTGGAISAAWTPNDGSINDTTSFSPIFFPDSTTTYTVALDSFSCLTYVSVTVSISDIDVDSTVVQTETCLGQADASITIFTSGAVNPQYSIDGGLSYSANNVFQPLAAGVYDIVVNENGSCDTSYQIIIVGGLPLVFDSILLTDPGCGNVNDGVIEVYVSSGVQPYEYSIDGGVSVQAANVFAGLAGGAHTVYLEDSLGCFIDSVVSLNQPIALTLGITQIDSLTCFSSNDGQIELNASNGVAPYQYSIDNSAYSSNTIFNNLSLGNYMAYARDTNMCVDSMSFDIYAPTAFSLAMDSTNVTCKDLADGTAVVTASGASGGYTYLWNDALAQNTATAVGLDVGNYQVIVSDANGCQDSLAVLIEEPDSLLLSLDDLTNVLCNGGNTGSISVSTTGGTIAYSYLWSNGGGANEDLSNATAGMYTLTVTDANACTAQLSATITEPTALTINLAGTNIFCFGGIDGEVDATVNGGVSPYTYGWTGPNGFTSAVEDINALSAGTYTLTVTDSNNCVMNESITITQPADVVITFSEVSVNCFGGNDGSLTAQVLTGGTAPFQFQWDAAANNQNTAMATGLIAGTYMVTVTDGNGCTFTNSSTVTEPLAPLQIAVTGTDINCAGYNDGIASVVATGGTAGYTYLWNDPQAQTNAQATNLSSNTYQVTVTDANGCTETGSVFIDEPTPIAVVATPDSANCWGDATGSITVEALGGTGVGYAYSLDGGETFQNSPNFLNLPAGVYDEIIVQDLGSNSVCLSQLYTTTVYEQPYFSFEVIPGDTTLQLEESITLELSVTSPNYTNSAIAEVNWYPTTGLNCADCIDPTVLTYEHYTEYTATVYYYGGDDELCSATANTIIQVENSLLLFIPNAFTPGSYDDVNRTFEVFGEGIEFVKMQVYNRWGEKVFESSNQRVSWDGTYKGEMQGPGVYSYYVNVEYLDGKTIDRKGSVSILR